MPIYLAKDVGGQNRGDGVHCPIEGLYRRITHDLDGMVSVTAKGVVTAAHMGM